MTLASSLRRLLHLRRRIPLFYSKEYELALPDRLRQRFEGERYEAQVATAAESHRFELRGHPTGRA